MPKRFQFPLETARRLRSEEAEYEEALLRRRYEEVRAIEEQVTQLAEAGARATGELLSRPSIPAEELGNLDQFRKHIRYSLQKLAQTKSQAQARAEAQRQRVVEAKRRYELLNRLRDKAWNTWRAAQAKEEEELAGELHLAKLRRESV